jgi:hypothetical protein
MQNQIRAGNCAPRLAALIMRRGCSTHRLCRRLRPPVLSSVWKIEKAPGGTSALATKQCVRTMNYTDPNSESTKKSYARFYQRRRQHDEEILFADDLTPIDKVYVMAVAHIATRVPDDQAKSERPADSTFASIPYIAEKLGLDPREVLQADRRMRKAGRIRVEMWRGREHRIFVLRNDPDRVKATKGDRKLYGMRGDYIAQVLFDTSITPAQRIVAIAVAHMRRGASISEIAYAVSVARKTVTRSIDTLLQSRHLTLEQPKANPGRTRGMFLAQVLENTQPDLSNRYPFAMANDVGHDLGHDLGHAPPASDCNHSEKGPISGNSVNTRTPAEYAPKPAASAHGHKGASRFQGEERPIWERLHPDHLNQFDTICTIIDDYPSGSSVAGIPKIAESIGIHTIAPIDVVIWVKRGLLHRQGDKISITHKGREALDYFKEIPPMKAAA